MADVNVDKIINNGEVRKYWKKITKDLFKVFSFEELLNDFLKETEENNKKYYKENNPYKKFIKNHIQEIINQNLKITSIADLYNLKPLKSKLRICPFHEDKNPSLSLTDKKNLFNCFGCGKKGDIIEFIRLLETLKEEENGKK